MGAQCGWAQTLASLKSRGIRIVSKETVRLRKRARGTWLFIYLKLVKGKLTALESLSVKLMFRARALCQSEMTLF